MNRKSNEEKDEDLKYIEDNWHLLTFWNKLHLIFLARWFLIRSRFRRIPLQWVKFQIELENRRRRK